jgi:indole-3-glycerol phosphate synthase
MNAFLARVVAQKRDEVTAGRRARPLAPLREKCAALPACRAFGAALVAGPDRIIAEVKRRSPSVPAFRRREPPAELARVYHAAGAAALSLVTDRANFGTGPEDIAPMRAAVPLPLVAKDFVIDPWQLAALRAAGADCVLLIARLLDGAALADLHAEALALGLDALVECHDEADVARAVAAGAGLIGINNRDLDTFTLSLETSRRLLPALPAGTTAVVESGIAGRAEVVELQALGAAAFLVGGSLLQSERPGEVLRALRGVNERREQAAP